MDIRRKKLLFIDSREAYRNIFSELLHEAGYDVRVSSSASEALKTVLSERFDVVISDTGSLGLDGIVLYLKTVDKKPEMKTRFLFVTGGHREDAKAREILIRLERGFIVRPFGMNELLKNISTLTGQTAEAAPEFRERFENRRSEKRFKWEEDCRITDNGSRKDIAMATTVDISKNGLRLRYLGAPIEPESIIDIDIKHLKVRSRGVIAWSAPEGTSEAVSGLRLIDPVDVSSLLTVIQSGRSRSASY